jgi:glycine cleavage system H protein
MYVLPESSILPSDLLYDHDGKVWIRKLDDFAVIGISLPHICLIGRPTRVKFTVTGSRSLSRGGYLVIVETRRYYGPVLSPLSGVIVDTNLRLLENPRIIADDPYGEGWVVKLIIESWDESSLVKAESVFEIIRRNGVRCFRHVPDYTVSGIGGECPETLARLSELMARLEKGDRVHLMTDNPRADTDVPAWASLNCFRIIEIAYEDGLKHFIIEK